MIRNVLVSAVLLLLPAASLAQNFDGTYSASNPQGGTITLTLRQDAQQRVTGTLIGHGSAFQVQGQVQSGNVLGTATSASGMVYIGAQIEGQNLRVLLAEPGMNGQPNFNTARQFVMARAGSSGEPTGGAMQPPPQAQQAPQAGTPLDAQLTQLLVSSAWCTFSYNQISGASTKERVVFGRDGSFIQQTGGEAYSSGRNGTYAGQSSGGTRGRWRVQGGGLQVSGDGSNWQPQPLQVTRNSSGYPIVNSGGKEYMQCG